MTDDAVALAEDLARRAPGQWELYRKTGESRELSIGADARREAWRREEGWAARWWERGAPRFASASDAASLRQIVAREQHLEVATAPPLEWPRSRSARAADAPEASSAPPPDLFDNLARQLSAEARGEATLTNLTLRRGGARERIENGNGLDVSLARFWLDGVAVAVGRRSTRSCEARLVFHWDGEPDIGMLARRLADRAILPLSEQSTPIERGHWLLDPSVAAAVLAGIAPLFTAARPRWVTRARLAAPCVTIVDDATADASYDGEGTATRRLRVVHAGDLAERMQDLTTAAQTQARSTGHGVRSSYRAAPSVGPRRLFFETEGGAAPLDLLSTVRRGLYATALTAPARFDLENDRFELEFTGIAILAGRAQTPVAGARARGRISQLLRRIAAVSTDRQFFPMPYPAGAPTILVDRTDFD